MAEICRRTHDYEGVAAFVISLDEMPRNPMLFDQLMSQGIIPKLVRAIDGRDGVLPVGTYHVDTDRFSAIIGREPSGAEIGCALSHLLCATKAQTEGAEYVLVLEEDAHIQSDLLPAIQFMRQMGTQEPRVLLLFSLSGPKFRKRSIKKSSPSSPAFFGRFFLPPASTVAYIANRSAINVLASKKVLEGVADWPPYTNAFEFWGLYPWPVSHVDDNSSIELFRASMQSRSKKVNKYWGFLVNYVRLFDFQRVRHHSKSLGGVLFYVRYVVVPQTGATIQQIRTLLLRGR